MNQPMNTIAKCLTGSWKSALLLMALICIAQIGYGQKAEELIFKGNQSRSVCPTGMMDAGTITAITPLGAQSQDINRKQIVLCFGDQIFINHAGDADLTEDPNPATSAGIGYAFYGCIPTSEGNDITTLTAADGCIQDMPPPPNGGIWVARGTPEGDVVFHNDGSIQDQFFGGAAGPLWFAPITVTNFDSLSFDDGSCLDVSPDEWFEVLYLNEITLDDFSTPDDMSLNGQFSLSGGMSEIDGANYTVTITKQDDPTVTGTIDAGIPHGGTTTFSVPEPGIYELTVTDSKGCSKTFTVSVPAVDPVGLCVPSRDVAHEADFCIPVLANDFNNVVSIAFTMTWDPSIIQFTGVQNANGIFTGISFDQDRGDEGLLPVLWFDASLTPRSLADGDTLFELCFRAEGIPGSSTPLIFGNDPTPISITDDSDELPISLKPGNIVITVPDLPTVFAGGCADATGTATVSIQAFGGADPYTYRITDLNTGVEVATGPLAAYPAFENVPNIPIGDYLIEIDDDNGIQDDVTINILADGLVIDTTVIDPTCSNSDDGVIRLNGVSGAVGDISTTWITPGETRFNVDSLNNLAPGSYQISAIDANGCVDTVVVELVADTLAINFAVVQPECEGQDGMITTNVVSSGTDFQYVWRDNQDFIVANVTSGSGYAINVPTGQYVLTLTKDICSVTDSVTLNPRTQLNFIVDQHDGVTCNGLADGEISLGISGRNAGGALQFNWTPNVITASGTDTSTNISQLVAGDYSLTVIDPATMCQVDTMFTVIEPSVLRVNPTITQPSCNGPGNDGALDLFFNNQGGTPFTNGQEYQYRWYDLNGQNLLFNTRNSRVENLPEGEFGIVIIDSLNCKDSLVVELSSGPSIAIIEDQAPVCVGESSGQLTVQGDLMGNSIQWSTGETSETISNLPAGLYTVQVTEMTAGGDCVVSDTVLLQDPILNITVNTPMQFVPVSSCNEPDSGRIFNLNLSGFSGPTSVIWPTLNDTTTIPFINVFQSGMVPFTVIDRLNGCELYDSVVDVQFPDRIDIQIDTAQVSCNGLDNGRITLVASGRGGLFDFAWSNGVNENGVGTSELTNLAEGLYSVVVTESSDSTCSAPLSFQIRQPDTLDLLVDSANTTNIRCFGDGDGQIQLIWEGGNRDAAPTITWTNNVAPNMLFADNLPAGVYTTVLEDSQGCRDSVTVSIIEPAEILANIPIPVDPQCAGFQTTVTVDTAFGGTGTRFTFSVDNGPNQNLTTAVPVFSGEHLITVFDEMGCRLDSMIFIVDPPGIDVDLGEDRNVTLGDSLRLIPTVNGIVPIDSFIWTPQEFLSCQGCDNPFASPEDDQVFEVVVIDANGCRGRDEVLIEVDKARKIYIPNGFSPNSDGVNDKWRIFTGVGVQRVNGTHIFDRWGNLVFQNGAELPNPLGSEGWDGTFEGQQLRPGVYAYMVEVEFVDGRVLLYRGDVTLTR